ncbi:hypothetical protein WJX72_003655 [[Myrmecia] bisecta]|uniref:NAD(P)-binding domain-containing protein n=1 Tax=[Myrmecia] bisecta TaxID=41462 RepID=A0AAW1Q3Q9_9CHLO
MASTRCRGFGDDLLDFITAGPKLRKWYGEGERMPTDGMDMEDLDSAGVAEAEAEEEGPRDAILVTDAESLMGEQIVLQLILARAKVRVLVRDAAAIKTAYGPYVTAISGTTDDPAAVAEALRGVRAAICPGKVGALVAAATRRKLGHLVLLSSTGALQPAGFSIGNFINAEQAVLRDPQREQAVQQSGVPYTIVRAGRIRNTPGGNVQLQFTQDDATVQGDISREDLAKVVTGALQKPPRSGLAFQVVGAGPGRPPSDWSDVFAGFQEA